MLGLAHARLDLFHFQSVSSQNDKLEKKLHNTSDCRKRYRSIASQNLLLTRISYDCGRKFPYLGNSRLSYEHSLPM